ncbi:MAG: hypothetical protein L0Y58_09430 [Verrucomicrobia subdivision 3 bacterium]|nr:hypothetical protein [Limisphaerales bacterium]
MKRHFLNGTILAIIAVLSGVVCECSTRCFAQTNSAPKTNSLVVSDVTVPENWKLIEEYFGALRTNHIAHATDLGRKLMIQATNDWKALNHLSWRIFIDRNIKHRDRQLALLAAQRALQLTRELDADVLDTHARALWENGKHTEAIQQQKRAIATCKDEAKRIEMQANLNRYVRLSRGIHYRSE